MRREKFTALALGSSGVRGDTPITVPDLVESQIMARGSISCSFGIRFLDLQAKPHFPSSLEAHSPFLKL